MNTKQIKITKLQLSEEIKGYQIKGKTFIVKAVFTERGKETLTTRLMRLIQSDFMQLFAKRQTRHR